MAEIIRITSEALQATVRRLLPSQQGFGEDLQATNVVTPIIDLTPSAEGSQLDVDLARAFSLDSQTSFARVGAGTTAVTSTTGFHRVFGIANFTTSSGAPEEVEFQLTDGFTSKVIWNAQVGTTSTDQRKNIPFDIIVYINSGETLNFVGTSTCNTQGTVRQVADVNGNIVNPAGFTQE